ncbi:CheA signal transduction histidine kinase [Methanococcus maripaludis C5]|uniref:Chemotaxis protein CheA n=1 Tax=Methanococcus maripaludis (strain C5 / ATCC BAA-1333) TaxID=402880 RepID=A4FXW0_METM5|nr:chemotaxis protein CheW [Methanococcus maripaludis]ABO35044.1 CheA signal transduction histidine kinase [Methanococcus maripaludis C5]
MDDMEQYKELFMTEAEEHLQSLNQNMVELENCPEDSERIINMIFRSAHTLKGSARTLGFEHISSLTHHMEDILDYIRDGRIKINPEIVDLLFKCLDALETMVSEVSDGENTTNVDVNTLVETIKSVKTKYLSGDYSPGSSVDEISADEKNELEQEPAQNSDFNESLIKLTEESTNIVIKGNVNDTVERPENLDDILNQMQESASALQTILEALDYLELKNTVNNIAELSSAILNEKVKITDNSLSVLKSSLLTMEKIAKVVESGSNPGDEYSELNEKILSVLADNTEEITADKEIILDHTIFNLEEVSDDLISEINENKKIYHVKAKVVDDCLLKAVRLTMVISAIKNIGRIISSVPSESDLLSSGSDEIDILISADSDGMDISDSVCEMEYVVSAQVNFEVLENNSPIQEHVIKKPTAPKTEDTCEQYKIDIKIDPECLLKAVRAYLVIKDLKEKGIILETEPSEEKIQEGNLDGNGVTIYYDTDESEEDIKEIISKTPEITSISIEMVHKSIEIPEFDLKNKNTTDATSKKQSDNSTSKKSQTVRVNIEKLDKLMNLVGEVVINRANFTQIATKYDLKELHNAVGRLNMLATELQEEVMGMRMIPVAFVFNRFPRTVRDTAKALGKEIDFEIEGSEIELDRTVLDELAEPLTHLIRNSLDHGIEHADERIKLGKPEKGVLKLIATRKRDRVNIIIKDDGKGINPDAMREKVIKKGMYTKEEAEKLTDNEAVNLIFLPGFSTAEVVSDVSGRGVGMDVVRSKIESLGGSVSVHSEVGKGTEITLHLPLTMAIIQTLLVRLKEQIYALPLTSVLDVISVEKDQIKNLEGQEAIIYREHILPVIWLKDALNTYEVSETENLYVVVVEKNKGKVGVILDEVIGRDEIVVKPLTGILKNINGLAGATILGDGRVALILDLNNI